MTPDREIRALARALGCERRELVQALEAGERLPVAHVQMARQALGIEK